MPLSNTEPLDFLVNRCVTVNPRNPVVFIVGAGISVDYPAAVPGVWPIMGVTLDGVMPKVINLNTILKTLLDQGNLEELELQLKHDCERLHERILPEMYYEILQEILGPEALKVWTALRLWHEDSDLKGYDLGPNTTHILITYLAWKGRTPVITTNFDTLLEAAAQLLGLIPYVCHPGEVFVVPDDPNVVAIWKVHGSISVDKFDTLRTTLQTLTMTDFDLVKAMTHHLERENALGCLIGYSGRDLDLFPYVVRSRPVTPMRWLDPRFDDMHMIHRFTSNNVAPFVPIFGKGSDLVNSVVAQLPEDPLVPVVNLIRDVLRRPKDREKEALSLIATKTQVLANAVLAPLTSDDDPRRLLIHAMALFRIGENKSSNIFVEMFLQSIQCHGTAVKPRLIARAFLLKAILAHDAALYEDSHAFALAAQKVAKDSSDWLLYVQSVIASDESLRVQYFLDLAIKTGAICYIQATG